MSPEPEVHVEIDFTPGAHPVSGRLTAGAGARPREFSGWMELVAALETARGAQEAGAAEDGAPPPA